MVSSADRRDFGAAHACRQCGRLWALRGSRSSESSWSFWCKFCDWRATKASSGTGTDTRSVPRQTWKHGVHVYDDVTDLVSSLERHLFEAWSFGGAGLVVATTEHRSLLRERLAVRNGEESLGEGRLVELDAHDTLELFMRNGAPDRHLFQETVGSLVREVASEAPLHAFGEMVDVLWGQGNASAALSLESLWSELQQEVSFSLLCGYAEANVGTNGRAAVSRVHDHILT